MATDYLQEDWECMVDKVKQVTEVAPEISQELGGRGFGKKDLIVKITNQLSRIKGLRELK